MFGKCSSNYKIIRNRKITANNVEINTVSETRFLGVADDKLSCKTHINHIKSEISIRVAVLYKAQDF